MLRFLLCVDYFITIGGKDLIEADKQFIIKEMFRATPPQVIAKSIGQNVDIMKRYLANPSSTKTLADAGALRTVTD